MTPQLQEALKKHEDMLEKQGEALDNSERGLKECSEALSVLEGKVGEMNQLAEQVKEMEVRGQSVITMVYVMYFLPLICPSPSPVLSGREGECV